VEGLKMNKRFWKDKTVLVTGYEGFLGSHLVRALISCGAKVVGFDKKVGRKETILSRDDYRRMIVMKGNVENYRLLKDLLFEHRIEIVFHLAAEAIVGKCQSNPRRTFSSNIKGTWNILEVCRHSDKISAVIIASSDKAYGEHKKLPYEEGAALVGRHPYDVSKSCADLLAHAYFHSYGLPVAITRCGNIYGPGDFNFSRIIPDALRCVRHKKTFLVRSDGRFVRDYVFVDDIVKGYMLLAENLKKLGLAGEAFNFSTNRPLSVLELLDNINKKSFRHGGFKYEILNKAKFEIKRQYLSSEKVRRRLGWRPLYSLDAGLERTLRWYLDSRKSL